MRGYGFKFTRNSREYLLHWDFLVFPDKLRGKKLDQKKIPYQVWVYMSGISVNSKIIFYLLIMIELLNYFYHFGVSIYKIWTD